MGNNGWIGVDLDGTLAEYHGWQGETHIGKPIPAMVDRVKRWIKDGKDVRIFTARVSTANGNRAKSTVDEIEKAIRYWCIKHIGESLKITCSKDFDMISLWDDRCVQVVPNTGERVDGKKE